MPTPGPGAPGVGIGRTNPINNWTDEVGHASLKAIDPRTGEEVWEFEQFDVSDSGMLTTATDLLFTGGREGYIHALDATSGELLWKKNLGGCAVGIHGCKSALVHVPGRSISLHIHQYSP